MYDMFLQRNVPSQREGGSVPGIISAVGPWVGFDTGHAGQTFLDGVTNFYMIIIIMCRVGC